MAAPFVTSMMAIKGQAVHDTALDFALETALLGFPKELHAEVTQMFNNLTHTQKMRLVRAVTRKMRAARREERQARGYGQ